MSTPPPPGPYGQPPQQGPYGQPPQYGVPPQQPVYQQPYPGGPPQPWTPQPPAPVKRPNPVGLAALICGIVACVAALFVPLYWLWLLTGFAAVVLGIIGLILPGRRRATSIWGLSLAPGSLIFMLIGTTIGIALGAITSVSEPDVEVSPPAVEVSESPSPAASEAPAGTREPVTWEGEGELTTGRAFLEGDYAVAWETSGDCYYSAELDDDFSFEVFSASSATSGTSNLYGVEAGEHYLDVITGPAPNCGWTVTLTPQ